MCGFAGFLSRKELDAGADERLARMGKAILHRGPDSGGVWVDAGCGVGLSHRRLSILDTSSHGAQPMLSVSGRYVIAFNGEIYNHLDLRASLEAQGKVSGWSGGSDTETLLACFDAYGIERTLVLTHGMFAMAIWDQTTQELTLVRDRLGEKPLYYGWMGDDFLFGSELKALKISPTFKATIDPQALSALLRYGYVPAPHSIYLGISKLMPGQYLKVSRVRPDPQLGTYWSIDEVVREGLHNPFEGSEADAVDELERQLKLSIKRQMISDVPLGAFLSGGVDSSAIVALMQAQSSQKIKTFSIGFNDARFNEAQYAKEVSEHIGTDHEELYISSQEALDVIPMIPNIWDEPFADPSQIPTYLVSRLAKSKVTVSLSGDGGDELFCGYNRYLVTGKLWKYLKPVPAGLRGSVGKILTSVDPASWDAVGRWLPGAKGFGSLGDKLHKVAQIIGAKDSDAIYQGIVSSYHDIDSLLRNSTSTQRTSAVATISDELCDVQKMMANDLKSYLPGDILTKLDRAAMAVSLEGRAPFLDHNIVELAWRLPLSVKFREGESKWVLKQVLYRHVDRALLERPKMGFGVPLREWLQGPLREWAEALLDERRLEEQGHFNVSMVRGLWSEHLSGKKNRSTVLWNILMFQAWLAHQ
ncbi:asparagine synthase (glutamine-hydrolyzing) [Pseudomonas donghuensis]|uniref:asparagine synthase (glutamine-hydrolyzing) n=1 Tax=Pseudomonas donghuensis TaxID=1163398 RepID=UPI0003099D7D|nr:asparagine synthase (glutamine-hydrolyzing) [Pseudomonas donghuensis]